MNIHNGLNLCFQFTHKFQKYLNLLYIGGNNNKKKKDG